MLWRTLLAFAVVALIAWGVNIWRKHRALTRSEAALRGAEIDLQIVEVDEVIAEKQDEIEHRRKALAKRHESGQTSVDQQ